MAGLSTKVHFITKWVFRFFLQFSAYCLVHSLGSLMTLCTCLYLCSCSAVLNPPTRIYDVIVLVIQCLQTSHTTLNSTEYLLGSTTVVTPQMLLAMHKTQTVSYRLYKCELTKTTGIGTTRFCCLADFDPNVLHDTVHVRHTECQSNR